ncbi:MAG: hypothetical protein E7618_03850 [Ruminococcaceae bacterium]|nr:hypothetical protein [Oscillospiraceae bacterium]
MNKTKVTIFVLCLLAMMALLAACRTDPSEMPSTDSTVAESQTEDTDWIPDQLLPDGGTLQETYQNPLIRSGTIGTWGQYGVGDPFVMRWNGRYYLYCSTKDGMVGIQCWTSDNLVDWQYDGLCATEALTMSAYAPEVVYDNGSFYMYTSPAGNGHYVLKSDSPTGPFVAVTGNFGLSIDGDVFIDDDGSWYFFSAGSKGILAYPMTAPDRVDAEGKIQTKAYMNGWTEGSMILKYNGYYYMTYTGNHVWNPGYRIDYAVSTTAPLDVIPAANNPLLLSTNRNTVMGIGHSSTVLSPDLDGYYIVYHSHKTVPQRSMNIDRIVLNGPLMEVLGPTVSAQEAPAMPDIYSRFETEASLDGWRLTGAALREGHLAVSEEGLVLSENTLPYNYSAEYNLLSLTGKAGGVFGYTDADTYGMVLYDAEAKELVVTFSVKGAVDEHRFAVGGSFGQSLRPDALMLFTLRKQGDSYTFLLNNRTIATLTSKLDGGAIGVTSVKGEAVFGFVGASDEVMQSAVKDLHKPVPGTIPALSCVEETPNTVMYDGVTYLSVTKGDTYNYLTQVDDDGAFALTLSYRAAEDCTLLIYQNGSAVGSIQLTAHEGSTTTAFASGITLERGTAAISFAVAEGSAEILSLAFSEFAEVNPIDYDKRNYKYHSHTDGAWTTNGGKLILTEGCGKRLFGKAGWSDYTVEAEITPLSEDINFGLVLRVTNPADSNGVVSESRASDYYQGYFVGLSEGSVVLGKQNYNWTELSRVAAPIQQGGTYHLKAEAVGNTIRIWLDGALIITYTDEQYPFLQGMVGVRGHKSTASIDNFVVTAVFPAA